MTDDIPIIDLTNPDLSEQITADIIQLVLKRITDSGGDADLWQVMQGITCALVAFIYRFHQVEDAKTLLIELAEQLDDPATLEWALTNSVAPPN